MSPIENPDSGSANVDRQSANWDLANAFRNYATMIVTQCAGAFFSFAAVWLATRYLGVDGYGEIAAIIAAAQIVQIFTAWTAVALSRYGTEEFVVTGKITRSFWARTSILFPNTLLIVALSLLWLPWISSWLKLPRGSGWLVLLFFTTISIWLHIQHALLGAKLPSVQGVLLAVERLLTVSIMFGLAWIGRLDPLTAVGAYIASQIVVSLIGILIVRPLVSWRFEFDRTAIRNIFNFSLPLIFAFIVLNMSNSYIDAIFITQYMTKADLGIYSVAYQFNGMFLQFPTLAGMLLVTLFITLKAKGEHDRVRTYMRDVLPVLTAIVGLVMLVLVAAASIFIGFTFGEHGSEIAVILTILSLSTVFATPCLMGYLPFFNSLSASYFWAVYTGVSAGVNIIGDILLIPRYGLPGSALATTLGQAAAFLVILLLVSRKYALERSFIVQATIPAAAGISLAYWTGSIITGIGAAAVLTLLLAILYRQTFRRGLNMLTNYRDLTSAR